MDRILKITKLTDNRFLNIYQLDARNRLGGKVDYYVASRAKDVQSMKLKTKSQKPDGVIIYSLFGEKRDKVILIRQYRYSIDGYIYEFPAGLIDEGENYRQAATREMKEETGLDFQPAKPDAMFEKPYYTSIGLTDECCAMAYGYASGSINRDGLEDDEDIEVVVADKKEIRRILKEENVSLMCAYMLMHFLKSENNPFDFLKE